MEDAAINATGTVDELQATVAEFILTELELGLTFLDIAETTADREHARLSVDHATTALRTADRFLSQVQPGTVNLGAIGLRRELLAERLHGTRCR
jgi:hypothetical protein